jgi:hypothetical protein
VPLLFRALTELGAVAYVRPEHRWQQQDDNDDSDDDDDGDDDESGDEQSGDDDERMSTMPKHSRFSLNQLVRRETVADSVEVWLID